MLQHSIWIQIYVVSKSVCRNYDYFSILTCIKTDSIHKTEVSLKKGHGGKGFSQSHVCCLAWLWDGKEIEYINHCVHLHTSTDSLKAFYVH